MQRVDFFTLSGIWTQDLSCRRPPQPQPQSTMSNSRLPISVDEVFATASMERRNENIISLERKHLRPLKADGKMKFCQIWKGLKRGKARKFQYIRKAKEWFSFDN